MARLVKTDGTVTEVNPANGKRFTLEELQGFVGGYFEHVRIPAVKGEHGVLTMYVNEDGLGLGLPPNMTASVLSGHFIVGDAVYGKGQGL